MPIEFEGRKFEFDELVDFLNNNRTDIENPESYAAELDMAQNPICAVTGMKTQYSVKMLVASKIEVLDEFEGRKGHFIRTFLINDTINYNGWMTTKDANQRQSRNWRGMPGVVFFKDGKRDHPEYDTKEEALAGQEDYRKATILATRWNAASKSWEEISEIQDDVVWQQILDKEIKYVSPSAWPDEVIPGLRNPLVVTDYTPLHYAFVDDPAFGFAIATVNGTCDGTTKKCIEELGPLVASVGIKIEKIIPDSKQKISQIAKTDSIGILPDKTKEQMMQEELDQLKAGMEDMKKQLKAAKDENEKDEPEKPKDETEKQLTASIEEHPAFKQLKASNEKLQEVAKNVIINKMLTAAKKAGATDDELKAQKAFMLKASIDQLEEMDLVVLSPLAKHFELFQVSASKEDVEFPDITQVSGSTKDDKETTDYDLLKEIGAIS